MNLEECIRIVADKCAEEPLKCNKMINELEASGIDFYSILHPAHVLGYCDAFDTFAKRFFIQLLVILNVVVYASGFILGLRNCYSILLKKGYWKSIFMVLHYLFGQAICVSRICCMVYFLVDF